jgi:hypothetical protein
VNCRYYLVGWLLPSVTAPPNAHFNPQLPIAVIVVHRNFSAIPPSFALPPPPPLPITIVSPAGRYHHCLPLQSCCRPLMPAAAHMPLLHPVARTPHPLPTAARMLAACRPLQSFPQPLPPAAAHTHAACCCTHAAAAAYCCTHATSTTAPVSTAPPPLLVPRPLIA